MYSVVVTQKLYDVTGNPVEQSLCVATRVRYASSCGPKFKTVAEEMLFVHFPLGFAGCICVGLSVSLVMLVYSMGAGSNSNTVTATGGNTKKAQKKKMSKETKLIFKRHEPQHTSDS